MIELHVWGPALGLPSIDPECLAAIAYLSCALSNEEWTVIVDTTSVALPPLALPALYHDSVCRRGYRSITAYVSSLPPATDLSPPSGTLEAADTTAFTNHIVSAFAPLLSLSLYVSPSNYINITRPLYSTLLPWPTQYAVPPALRTAAEAQTAHLGISSFVLDENTNPHDASSTSQTSLPSNTLFKKSARQTVSSLLGRRTEGSAVIRLAALVEAALEPLDELLGDKRYLISHDKMGALDCVVFGYLSLGLVKDLPSPWLREGIQRFSKLEAYVERCREECFGQGKLKRGSPVTGGWADRAMGLLGALPMPEALSGNVRIIDDSKEATHEKVESSRGYLIPTLGTAGAVIAAGAVYLFYANIHISPEPLQSQRARKLESMGETGAMLASLADQMDTEVQREIAKEQRQDVEVNVEVEVTSEDSNPPVKGL